MLLFQVILEHFNARFFASFIEALEFGLLRSPDPPEHADAQNDEEGSILFPPFICEYLSQRSEKAVSFLLLELDWKDETII